MLLILNLEFSYLRCKGTVTLHFKYVVFRFGTSTQLGCSEISATAQNRHHYEKSNSTVLMYAQTENNFLDQLLFSLFTHTKTVFREFLLWLWDWRIVVELEPASEIRDFYFCIQLK